MTKIIVYNKTMPDIVQIKNPRTNRYVKIDRDKGHIISHKKKRREIR